MNLIDCIKNLIINDYVDITFSNKNLNEFLNDKFNDFKDEYQLNELDDEYIKAWLQMGIIARTDYKNLNLIKELSKKFPQIIYLHFFIAMHYRYKSNYEKLIFYLREGAKVDCPISIYYIFYYYNNTSYELPNKLYENDDLDYLAKSIETGCKHGIFDLIKLSEITEIVIE